MDENIRMGKIRELLRKMPAENVVLLRYLIEFLYEVQLRSHANRMTAANLAIVFGYAVISYLVDSNRFINDIFV